MYSRAEAKCIFINCDRRGGVVLNEEAQRALEFGLLITPLFVLSYNADLSLLTNLSGKKIIWSTEERPSAGFLQNQAVV